MISETPTPPDVALPPTPAELAQQEAQRAQQEARHAQQEADREKPRSQDLEALLERYRARFGELPE